MFGKSSLTLNKKYATYDTVALLRLLKREGYDIDKIWNSSFTCLNPKDGKECWECKNCLKKYNDFKEVDFDLSKYFAKDASIEDPSILIKEPAIEELVDTVNKKIKKVK